MSTSPKDTKNSKSVNESPPNTGPKNISVYLGDNRQKFEALKTFYPEMTIPNIVNSIVEDYISTNDVLFDDSLKTRMSKNIELGIQFLEKCDKWTYENVEKEHNNKSILGKIAGSNSYITKIGTKVLHDLPPKNKERLILSLCEILFISFPNMRKSFTEHIKKHDSNCTSDGEGTYWDDILEDFPLISDLSLDDFLKNGADVPILNPVTLQSRSSFLETTLSVDELLENGLHDHQIIWCICLLDSLADCLNAPSSSDKSIKIIDSEKDLENILNTILEFYERDDFNYKQPVIDIHTDGKLSRSGREFVYPVHILEVGDGNEGKE
jgi:hypothetical protein